MRLGVFGGCFDPIHLGHLVIAEEARWRCDLERVLFVVTARPPHKPSPEAGSEDRFSMVELAVENEPVFEASRIEIDRGGYSYTKETLQTLQREYPEAEIFLIVGGDSAVDFSAWREPDAVIEMARIVVAPRPGFQESQMEPRLRGKTELLDSPTIAISSTMIRQRIRDGKPIRFLVHDSVEKYIREKQLYTGQVIVDAEE